MLFNYRSALFRNSRKGSNRLIVPITGGSRLFYINTRYLITFRLRSRLVAEWVRAPTEI